MIKRIYASALVLAVLLLAQAAGLAAQDFGFGFDETEPAAAANNASLLPFKLKIGGEINAGLQIFVQDLKDADTAETVSALDVISGKLNFSASGEKADAHLGLNLSAASIGELWDKSASLGNPTYTPLIIDEAYLRGYLGPVDIEAGLRKLTWGRADSLGPLDVVNPLDYSDLTNITDIMAMKIARPMVHVTWGMGDFSKLEAVFIPNFAGHRFARDGRWTPSQFADIPEIAEAGILGRVNERFGAMIPPSLLPMLPGLQTQIAGELLHYFNGFSINYPNTGTINYFQSGLRYTTTIGPADIGAQYYYGNLFRPGFTIAGVDAFIDDLGMKILSSSPPIYSDPSLLSPRIEYNRYHQLGIDYAQVIACFNIRAEFAAHITEDLAGDNGAVKNPFLAWSLGFDRSLIWGITANIQCNETIRLLNGKVGDNPVQDSEAGTDATATRLTMQVSKKFFRDNLECKITNIWDVEDKDCYIIPSIAWTISDVTAELSAGVFAGEEAGELGQYWKSSFVKLGVTYKF
ncbi:hypothetical protein AGMMS50293_14170 [Spirochaetia bacterium]|nr:hypothetical protein AGMMS50293_14170 [Spirochaetia bacterium]